MVHMDETLTDVTVAPLEIKFADRTACSVVLDAVLPRLRIAFVTVDQHPAHGSFFVRLALRHLAKSPGSAGFLREAMRGNLCQPLLSFVEFCRGKEMGIALFEYDCLDG